MNSSPYLVARSAQRVAADRIDEGDTEGFHAGPALAAGRRIRREIAEGASRGAGRGFLRRRCRQRIQLPGGAKAAGVDRPLERQEATGERWMRPVRGQGHPGRLADRREGEIAGADQLDRHLHRERIGRAGNGVVHGGVEAAAVRRVTGARQHRGLAAIDTDRGAAHAARVAEREQHLWRLAAQARAGVLGLRPQGAAVRPGGGQGRLHHVAVDLEDAAIARLERDLGGNVEAGRRRGQLPGAALGHHLAILALALDCIPALDAVALQDRTEHGLAGGEAGGDARLGLAQPPFALGDDGGHGLQGDAQGEQDENDREDLAEQREARRRDGKGHGGLRRKQRSCDDGGAVRRRCEANVKACLPCHHSQPHRHRRASPETTRP